MSDRLLVSISDEFLEETKRLNDEANRLAQELDLSRIDYRRERDRNTKISEALLKASDKIDAATVAIKRLDAENARLRDALEWVRSHYASGSTKEINARIEAALKGEDL